jgi:hypothetical protein
VTAIELTEKIQGGVLKAIETSQSWTLGALKSTSSALDAFKPDPALIPFADKVPTPSETLEVAFGFWGKLLETQHSFFSGVVDIYAPPATKVVPPTATKKI